MVNMTMDMARATAEFSTLDLFGLPAGCVVVGRSQSLRTLRLHGSPAWSLADGLPPHLQACQPHSVPSLSPVRHANFRIRITHGSDVIRVQAG